MSDPNFHGHLEDTIDDYGLRDIVQIVSDANDKTLWSWYEMADILVSPSLHEGLCVPVIEAYIAGCRVVASDAANLPFVVQAPDPVVPAGDVDALADAIVEMISQIASGIPARPPGADALVERFSTISTMKYLTRALKS